MSGTRWRSVPNQHYDAARYHADTQHGHSGSVSARGNALRGIVLISLIAEPSSTPTYHVVSTTRRGLALSLYFVTATVALLTKTKP